MRKEHEYARRVERARSEVLFEALHLQKEISHALARDLRIYMAIAEGLRQRVAELEGEM